MNQLSADEPESLKPLVEQTSAPNIAASVTARVAGVRARAEACAMSCSFGRRRSDQFAA